MEDPAGNYCYNASVDDIMNDRLSNYECANEGLLLPITSEYGWPIWLRALLYLLGMLWSFLGIAIIADVFMCAIETITSKKRTIKVSAPSEASGEREVEIKVWNDTVANLTLMALGSSSPEILLSIIEIVGSGFKAGELGPGTIVGSAAFNLMVITGVCVIAIPTPNIRRVHYFKVFLITAFFSVFAYVWLIIVIIVSSPDEISLWEAIVTFLMFPLLVLIAYAADRDFFCLAPAEKPEEEEGGGDNMEIGMSLLRRQGIYTVQGGQQVHGVSAQRMREIMRELKKNHPQLSLEDIAKLAAAKLQEEQQHSKMWYRINATRSIGGNPRLLPSFDDALAEVYEDMKRREHAEGEVDELNHVPEVVFKPDNTANNQRSVIEFDTSRVSVMENDKKVTLIMRRFGKMDNRIKFRVDTIDGTAESGSDYIAIHQDLIFDKNETEKTLTVEIVDDNEWEPDEVFFVKMCLDIEEINKDFTVLGKKSIVEVTIVNDDDPGTFQFTKPSFLIKENCGKAQLSIERFNGYDGTVTITWKTEDMTAKNNRDFYGGEGKLIFEHGESIKNIEIPIVDDLEFEKDEHFKVLLTEIEPAGGAKFGKTTKTIVTLLNDDDYRGVVGQLVNMTSMNLDALKVDSTTWAQQFRNAMNVNGGELETATNMDYIMHFLTFGWKIVFALVPPPSICGGWLSFFIALGFIGVLTAVVGDLAATFGCLVGCPKPITAITFVALGTSLPDLFASKQAALMDKYADNSVGNVTGSNSVNVFLGLGLPWLIATIYWKVKEGRNFDYPRGSVAFSVAIFTVCAIVCLSILLLRRFLPVFGKGELGGKQIPKMATAVIFVSLWFFYIIMSSLQTVGVIEGF